MDENEAYLMIERLQRAIAHLDQLPADVQEELAIVIEDYTESYEEPEAPENGSASGTLKPDVRQALSLAGAWSDLPDDFLEVLDRMRHETAPTPPIEFPEYDEPGESE